MLQSLERGHVISGQDIVHFCWSQINQISYKNKKYVLCGLKRLLPSDFEVFNEKSTKVPELSWHPNNTADGPEIFHQTAAVSLLSLFSYPSVSSLVLLPFIPCSFLSISAPSPFPDNLVQAHITVLLAPYAGRDTPQSHRNLQPIEFHSLGSVWRLEELPKSENVKAVTEEYRLIISWNRLRIEAVWLWRRVVWRVPSSSRSVFHSACYRRPEPSATSPREN